MLIKTIFYEEKMKLKFGFTDDFGNETYIEKTFDAWNESQFDTILTEIAQCLMACGFTEQMVNESILYPQ